MNKFLHTIGWKIHKRWDTNEIMVDIVSVLFLSLIIYGIIKVWI